MSTKFRSLSFRKGLWSRNKSTLLNVGRTKMPHQSGTRISARS